MSGGGAARSDGQIAPSWRMAVTSSSGRTARTIPTARPVSGSDTIHAVTRSRSRSPNSPRETN